MPFLVVALLVAAVHLPIAWGAWTGVGFLADDHEMVGVAVYQHRGVISLWDAFAPMMPPDAPVALYRPILGLLFWLEQPLYGTNATGYHVTNSLLHCMSAVAWWALVRRWTGSPIAGLAAALFFTTWPGHSEALHWIAARTNVLSTCLLALALLAHDVGCARADARRWPMIGFGALLAALAVGAKESAVFVGPVAFAIAWARAAGSTGAQRAVRAIAWSAPMAIALGLFLLWRAHVLGIWGSGTAYGWRAARIGLMPLLDWLRVLVAPAHAAYAPAWLGAAIGAITLVLLAHALAALRHASVRAAAGPSALLLALGVAAGLGLDPVRPDTLDSVRYAYEASLGLCGLLALGVAAMPASVRGASLVVALAAFQLGLAANQQPWLRLGAVMAAARAQTMELAARNGEPLAIIDAPALQDGACAVLNGQTQFAFWQATAPAGADLRGSLRSDLQWRDTLADLAGAARAKSLAMPTYAVRWHDGALVPVALDPQWPARIVEGVTVAYARLGRCEALVGDAVPAQALVQTDRPLTMRAVARAGDEVWAGEAVVVAAADALQAIELRLPVDATAVAGREFSVDLLVSAGDVERRLALGATRAVAR